MYAYLLESQSATGRRYIGSTRDLRRRLKDHNACKSPHSSKYVPWRLVAAFWFADPAKAEQFEYYLKSGSGHAFAIRSGSGFSRLDHIS